MTDEGFTFDPWGKEDPDEAEEMARLDYAAEFARDVTLEERRILVRQAARRKVAREERADTTRPELVRLDDFLAVPYDDPGYRIDRLWPTGGRVLLTAQWKAGKSTAVGNIIRSLADGDPFLAHYEARRADNIVLIDNELDPRRIQAWLSAQGIVNPARARLLSLKGRVSAFDILDDDVRAEWAKDLAGADIIILDCLRPILDALGLDESHEAGRFLVAFDALLADLGNVDAIIVHHMGHGPERSRGDSRLLDWPDAIWKIVRTKEEDDSTLDEPGGPRFFSAYGRDVDEPEAELGYDPDTRHLTLGDHTVSRRQVTERRKTTRSDERVMSAVSESPGITKGKLRVACSQLGGHNPDTDASVERLVERGLILRHVTGQTHLHYPASPVDNPVDNCTVPTVPTRAHENNGQGGMVTVPVPIYMGTVTMEADDPAPAADLAEKSGHGRCPHGMIAGDQPDDFVKGRLSCPQCALAAKAVT